MIYVLTNLFNYIMFILVMVMSRDIVNYVNCMLYVLCEITIIIKLNNFIYLNYNGIITSVYGIMFISKTS